MNLSLLANIMVFALLLWILSRTHSTQWSLSRKVLLGMILGIGLGLGLQLIYGASSLVIRTSVQWFDVVGNGYVQLLQMVVMPLVFASILSAVARLHNAAQLGKISLMTIGVLLFTTAMAALKLLKDDAAKGERVLRAIDTLQSWVMKLVRIVMMLTPYGVLALMTKVVASSNMQEIIKLGGFVLVSYLALALMFGVHGLLLGIFGINPGKYFQKIWPVLTFAFTSRSSAASIPLNIEAQTQRLGVPKTIAGFAASFGATIGQNGCAGLYPAMLATMIAPTVGINTLDPWWIATLVGMVTISSAGVAGVGGGATFAALIVLPAMGLPITLVALLISVEPLIDMGRTALNVSGAMTAGTLTSQWLHQTNKKILNSTEHGRLVH